MLFRQLRRKHTYFEQPIYQIPPSRVIRTFRPMQRVGKMFSQQLQQSEQKNVKYLRLCTVSWNIHFITHTHTQTQTQTGIL